jgi:phosphoesterase RecJ-like protein
MKPLQELYPFLTKEPRKVVVTMHQKPDPDAMGSSLDWHIFSGNWVMKSQ